MRIPDITVEELLKKSSVLSVDKLKALIEQADNEKLPLQELVLRSNILDEATLTKLYAESIGIPFVDINVKELDREILKQIPEKIAKLYNMVVFAGSIDNPKEVRQIAMEDADDLQAIDVLHKLFGQNIKIFLATKFTILSALDQYRGNIGSEINKVITESGDADDEELAVSEDEIAEDSPIAQTVNLIIEYAIKSGASDIHIEPRDKNVIIRYRIDGVLREANRLPKRTLSALVSRIKILSNLKIDERRAPQDGRFKITMNGRVFAFRVSTLPISEGEKVVMRVLDESSEPLPLLKLGFWGKALQDIQEASVEPHGMLLVTGPTGSGKSTTLHSVLHILNKPDVNISTIEDPIEYKLEGVNQTQVNPVAGMSFVAGLRALLRQDPNIIMVGEIRDSETAGLGVQAALTGHLVFSTLHTNNAATCLPRLLDMGIEPFLIASVVRVVIGQRLVRRLVPEDSEAYEPNAAEKKEIERAFNINSKQDWYRILSLVEVAQQQFERPKTNGILLYRPKKNLPKERTGYKGRMGIYEVLANTTDVQKMIVTNSTSEEIQKKAVEEGMVTMQLDGLIKAMLGMTSIEEILRVTRE
ncbi:type II/IV secretion system protein [bacterium]|nr:type II/IV secretion system protein [bacterium]NBX97672.1 type II/IV secretion system protein [bacterium]NDC94145.1 type II/IV secretion system protein [bacterium]NDD83142.1 type II/IV secretion system protein [bacterium]NDG29365.1 type II/IV secretion system protein [bacterium]